MPDVMLEPRATNLEELMAQLLITVDRVERQLGRTDRQFDRTDRQLEQTQRNLDQLSSEMRDFKDEMRESRREMNKKWGELSNKMGTMAEDLVAPSIGRTLRTAVGCPEDKVDFATVRTRKRYPVTGH